MTYQIPPLKRLRLAQDQKSPESAGKGTPNPDIGATPIFLDTIEDFSDIVDFYAKCDQIAHAEEPTGKGMSRKNCRFCS